MRKLLLVLFVALVGCSSGAFCDSPTRAACPPIDGVSQTAWCIRPGADECFARSPECAFEDVTEAACSGGEGPTCADGWTLHCY